MCLTDRNGGGIPSSSHVYVGDRPPDAGDGRFVRYRTSSPDEIARSVTDLLRGFHWFRTRLDSELCPPNPQNRGLGCIKNAGPKRLILGVRFILCDEENLGLPCLVGVRFCPKYMNKVILAGVAANFLGVSSSFGATLFSDDFSYSNGNLVGQGGWLQTSTTATSPIQVSNGAAVLGTSGQDIYAPLVSSLSLSAGTSFYYGLTINVSAAQATGDHFAHFTPVVGDSTAFFGRTYIKSSGAGFVLGYMETSGTGSSVNYGSPVLSFGQSYRVVVAYNSVNGTLNDTASLYVNPSDTVFESNNTPYLTDTWTSVSTEPAVAVAMNLRQGTAANAPTLTVDFLSAGDAFSSAARFSPVPEPSTWALFGAGVIGLALVVRRKGK